MKDENFHRNNNNCSGAPSSTLIFSCVCIFLLLLLSIFLTRDSEFPFPNFVNFVNAFLLVLYTIFLVHFLILSFFTEKTSKN